MLPSSRHRTQDAYDLQELNRYSYVDNNPLSLTDPTGYGGKGGFFKTGAFRQLVALAVVILLQQYEVLPAIGAELGFTTTSAAFAGTVNAGIAGGIGGAIATGTLKGTLLGAAQAVAFAGVHFAKGGLGFPEDASAYSTGEVVASAGMHGMVGGLFSMADGGKFESGFLAGGISDVASTTDSGDFDALDAVKHAALGGAASMLGGGKFMNGAVTGTFGYLFNEFLVYERTAAIGGWHERVAVTKDNGHMMAGMSFGVVEEENYQNEHLLDHLFASTPPTRDGHGDGQVYPSTEPATGLVGKVWISKSEARATILYFMSRYGDRANYSVAFNNCREFSHAEFNKIWNEIQQSRMQSRPLIIH